MSGPPDDRAPAGGHSVVLGDALQMRLCLVWIIAIDDPAPPIGSISEGSRPHRRSAPQHLELVGHHLGILEGVPHVA